MNRSDVEQMLISKTSLHLDGGFTPADISPEAGEAIQSALRALPDAATAETRKANTAIISMLAIYMVDHASFSAARSGARILKMRDW